MPRYHFYLTDGEEVLDNQKTIELAGPAAALEEALVLARDLKEGKIAGDQDWEGWFVEIKDDNGQRIDMVPIDAVPEEP